MARPRGRRLPRIGRKPPGRVHTPGPADAGPSPPPAPACPTCRRRERVGHLECFTWGCTACGRYFTGREYRDGQPILTREDVVAITAASARRIRGDNPASSRPEDGATP